MNEKEQRSPKTQTPRNRGADAPAGRPVRPRPVRDTAPQRAPGQQTHRPSDPRSAPHSPGAAAPGRRPAPQGGAPGRPAGAYRPEHSSGALPKRERAGGDGRERSERAGSVAKGKGKFLRTPLGVTVFILSTVGVLLLGTIFALYFSGIRYVNYDFVEQQTGRSYSIRFIGKTDGNGVPCDGTVHYADGSTAALSEKDGAYCVEYKNGDIYEGPLLQLQKHGKGVLTLASGDRYEGEFAYDDLSGEGRYEYITGDVYEGSFAAGRKNGYGVYTWAKDAQGRTAKYEGYFEKDLRSGEGTFTYADGSVYKGSFREDKKEDVSGEFHIQNADGSSDVYIGGFAGDVREGYGEYTWANGDVYKGEFKNNLLDGEGTYIWASGRTYKGSFTAGKIDADGTGYYTSGDAGDSGAASGGASGAGEASGAAGG